MKKALASAKTIDEAVEKALRELGVSKDRVNVRVLEEPSKGFLGLIGTRDAKVEVEVQYDPIEEGRGFLADVLKQMNLNVKIDSQKQSEGTVFHMIGEDLGMVIGRRGQTLDSLQYLVNVVANKHAEKHVRIILDAENYRAKRREALEKLAYRLAQKAIHTKRNVRLEPMTAAERKVIHAFLQTRTDVITFSEGEEPHRYIVVAPKTKEKEASR
ncbi:DNA-binding protein [Brevibacillus sp. SKDU10]|uniref:RNA-binding cell elongation regulator Jag/EloR n=1 Tax=Brevibacillus sp. SKDU10 TaxID=1247872 RepID=UPI0007C9117F|nr:RNA-binding cell elongation regulator Jag/EloR [Brevibacillus sp. SKDU10]OAJ74676.1 DNA-binding protein [Brevibacillus sp. SKDU10]